MYYCPKCKIPLTRGSNKFGIFWVCPECNGRTISLYVLRKALPDQIVNDLWLRAKSGKYKQFRKCPACKSSLPEVPVVNISQSILLDICTKCNLIWFDRHEYESLPQKNLPTETELPQKAKEALAQLKIESIQKQFKDEEKYDLTPNYNVQIGTILDILFFSNL
jgi:Zn-finger nucleic acid-binding protein